MEKGYVYKLICPITNSCRYIGKTVQSLNKRLYKHFYEIDVYKSHKNSWLKHLRNIGLLDNIKIELIEECEIQHLNDKEIYWISVYKNQGHDLTNLTPGGEVGSLGHKHSEEAKRKISEASKKQKRKKCSKETREKIRQSLIGKPGRNKGNKHSEAAKEKISNTKKGKVSWNATPILQLTKQGEFVKEWISSHAAAKELKISQGNIWSAANGIRNSCGGFKWKLKD